MQLSTLVQLLSHTHSCSLVLGLPNIVVADLEVSQLRLYPPLSAASAFRSLPRAHLLPGLKDCVQVSPGSWGNSFDTEMDIRLQNPGEPCVIGTNTCFLVHDWFRGIFLYGFH